MYLDNRKLGIMMAQEKGEVEQKQKEREKKEPKDNRNLYLAREGIIREGNIDCLIQPVMSSGQELLLLKE